MFKEESRDTSSQMTDGQIKRETQVKVNGKNQTTRREQKQNKQDSDDP